MGAVGWYVGLVHYPTFLVVRDEDWQRFHAMHSNMTGVLVGPPILGQVGATLLLFALEDVPAWVKWGSVACLVFSVGWTGVVSGPLHGPLSGAKDVAVIERLIATNWPRALAWTLQAGLAGWAAWWMASRSA